MYSRDGFSFGDGPFGLSTLTHPVSNRLIAIVFKTVCGFLAKIGKAMSGFRTLKPSASLPGHRQSLCLSPGRPNSVPQSPDFAGFSNRNQLRLDVTLGSADSVTWGVVVNRESLRVSLVLAWQTAGNELSGILLRQDGDKRQQRRRTENR